MTKRPIVPLSFAGVVPDPPRGERPTVTWIAPTDILVEEAYQRGIGERGRGLIATIYAGFDWRLWRLPLCVWTDDGLEAIDGQHSLIAAASLGIAEVPILIVEAPALENRAELFVSVNKDRLALTRLQMHAAKVLAGDPNATQLDRLCRRLGIRLLRATPAEGRYKPRETMAVASIATLLRRYDEADAERILAAVAHTEAAPITVVMIKAAELLLTDPEFVDDVDPALITAAATSLPDMGEQEAKLFAATHCVPVWRGLASIWFKASKKLPKRPAPKLATVADEPAYPQPPHPALAIASGPIVNGISRTATGGHVIDRRPTSRIVDLGDMPGPGRSALDVRRALS